MGSEGKWYCFCHVGRSASENDRITRTIRDLDFIVQCVIDLRGARGTPEWPQVYRNMQQRLMRAGRRDLLMGNADCPPNKPGVVNLTMWLMRLERELINAVASRDGRSVNAAIATAELSGPVQAASFNPYPELAST
ncbi:hypothetical protein WS68_07570 [Burkholderia sp. TSV86]|nr:hypothetical protein WS68_07570 [Burkholderia sp. TSV86]